MEKIKLSFPSIEEIFGTKFNPEARLKVFKILGSKACITDYSLLLGCEAFFDKNSNELFGVWTTKNFNPSTIYVIDEYGQKKKRSLTNINVGIRPIINYLDIKENCKKQVQIADGVFAVKYGEYPKKVVNNSGQKELEQLYCDFKIQKTRKVYSKNFCSNYEYVTDDGRKFVRFIVDDDYNGIPLSNGKKYNKGEFVWIEVQPIIWIVDKKTNIAISDNIISSKKFKIKQYVTNFDCTNINLYLNSSLAYDIIPSNVSTSVFDFDGRNCDNNMKNKYEDDLKAIHNILYEDYLKKTLKKEKLNKCKEILEKGENLSNEELNFVLSDESEKNKIIVSNPAHLIRPKENYGIYLTDKKYSMNPAIGRDEEIRSLSKNLLIPKTGTILIGEPGVGKTAIVEGLSYQIQNSTICDLLKNKGVLSVSISALLAGCQYRGTFEQKINNLCDDLSNSKDVILFLDEMHATIGAGGSMQNDLDMANMLKTFISNDQIKIIGCTTTYEYNKYFSNDKAFRRRFNVIEIKETSKEALYCILQTILEDLSLRFNIKVELSEFEINSVLELIIKLSLRKQKYSYELQKNPDSSIKLLTSCFAYMAISNIKNAKYSDFIDGIKDNENLNLSKMEIENMLPVFDENDDIYNLKRSKIFIKKS